MLLLLEHQQAAPQKSALWDVSTKSSRTDTEFREWGSGFLCLYQMIQLQKIQFEVVYHEKFLLRRRDAEALAQAAQGEGGHTVLGGVQGLWRCDPEGHGQ